MEPHLVSPESKIPMRILHLNASSSGGAFVAAQRLSEALNHMEGVDSRHLVFEGSGGDFSLWADSWFKQALAFGMHAIEKLDFLRFEKDKTIRFAFSHGNIGLSLETVKLFNWADVIHLHWINKGFISLDGIERLLNSQKKIVWTCHDLWPFTGGCYHPRGCDHFQLACGNCHYLRNPSLGDLSARVFKRKQALYQIAVQRSLTDKSKDSADRSWVSCLHFVAPSRWLGDQAKSSGIWGTNPLGLQSDLDGIVETGVPKRNLTIPISIIPNPIDTNYFYPSLAPKIWASNLSHAGNSSHPENSAVKQSLESKHLLSAEASPLSESGTGIFQPLSFLKSNCATLLFVAGNLGNEAKGFSAFRQLCVGLHSAGHIDFQALVVGENRIGDLNLPCHHIALGFIANSNHMREVYWHSDVFVITSKEENLPTTIMESLACGLPVAGFNVGGIPEMVDAKTGFLADSGDVNSLVLQVGKYLNYSQSEKNTMREAARAFALESYAASRVASRYLQIYTQQF